MGDVQDQLRTVPDESVHCVVTSPPYWGLRNYGVAGQLGLEKTPEEYVARMVGVFREVRRVLRNDGVMFLNLGDSYAGSQKGMGSNGMAYGGAKQRTNSGSIGLPVQEWGRLKPKDLVGIPWRLAFALQADGWWLRSDIIWHKPNPMPESVTDRPTKSHEYVFLLTKSERYFFDQEAVREQAVCGTDLGLLRGKSFADVEKVAWHAPSIQRRQEDGIDSRTANPSGSRNLRTVWTIPTQPYREAHFATFPEKLVEPCVKAGTSERGCCATCGMPWVRQVRTTFIQEGVTRHRGKVKSGDTDAKSMTMGDGGKVGHNDVETLGWHPPCAHPGEPVPATVLDPFCGSGTTGVVALRLGRSFLGIELNPQYVEMARRRITEDCPLFNQVAVP